MQFNGFLITLLATRQVLHGLRVVSDSLNLVHFLYIENRQIRTHQPRNE